MKRLGLAIAMLALLLAACSSGEIPSAAPQAQAAPGAFAVDIPAPALVVRDVAPVSIVPDLQPADAAPASPFVPARSAQYRIILIREARLIWGLDANVALFAGQIHQESMWKADAVSRVGARGLGQHMPATAKELHEQQPMLSGLPMYSALWSIRALLIYNKKLYVSIKPYGGDPIDVCDRLAMMLASYNGGLGWLNRDRKLAAGKGGDPDAWFGGVENYSNRAPWAFKENRHYPDVILNKHTPLYLNAHYPGVDPCPSL